MNLSNKPLFKYYTSTTFIDKDDAGNVIINKVVKNDNATVVLKFKVRTDRDVKKNRMSAYPILVP